MKRWCRLKISMALKFVCLKKRSNGVTNSGAGQEFLGLCMTVPLTSKHSLTPTNIQSTHTFVESDHLVICLTCELSSKKHKTFFNNLYANLQLLTQLNSKINKVKHICHWDITPIFTQSLQCANRGVAPCVSLWKRKPNWTSTWYNNWRVIIISKYPDNYPIY